MPAGIVELEDDAFLLAYAGRLGEVSQNCLEHVLADRIGDVPNRAAGRGFDKPGDIEPFETMMANGDRAFSDGRPDAAPDRLQTDPMLVGRPDFDNGAGMPALFFSGGALQFFFKAVRSSSVAASGWRGRGF